MGVRHIYRNRDGFTIVELLIVVVVIAILAAITIVAYNGIQDRSRRSSIQASAKQAYTKVATYATLNNDTYPPDLATAGINDGATTYQYRVDNSATPASFCITATSQNISYYISSTVTTPTAGACAGHGLNGVAAITNLVVNPSIESNTNDCSVYSGGASVNATRTFAASGNAPSGDYIMRAAFNASVPTEAVIQCFASVEGGKTYSARVSARPSWVGAMMRLQLSWQGVGGAWSASPLTSASKGQWSVRSYTAVAPAGATGVNVQASFRSGTLPVSGDTLDADSFMLVESSTIGGYADGSSPGWVWNGTPNNSTSTGPAL
jgi:prepilin-type N-terminal cleavage/methylation domain-containing protein